MRALITGATGFVGPYLRLELEAAGYDVRGLDRAGESEYSGDLLDQEFVDSVIQDFRPDRIFHLAGFSSVAKSFDEPEQCRKINVDATESVLNAVRKYVPKARILVVTSAHVYGKPVYVPLDEKHPLNPESPYAESRVVQEKLALASGLDVVISRSFNHTGPGQPIGFVFPDFANRIKETKDSIVKVGNLEPERDFSDVRDVVQAYRILLEKGAKGEIYNVSSGKAVTVKSILDAFIELSGKDIEIKIDESKFRPADVQVMYGDNSKLLNLGWKAEYKLNDTIKDTWEAIQAP